MTAFHRELVETMGKVLEIPCAYQGGKSRIAEQIVADRCMLRIRLKKTLVAPLHPSLEQPNDVKQGSDRPMDFKFNVNHAVKVKLTSEGLAELKRQRDELYAYYGDYMGEFTLPKTDEEGYSEFQLWDLMYRLGRMMKMGTSIPFQTDMIFLGGEPLKGKR